MLPVRCHFDSVYRVVIAGTAQVEQMTLMATVFSESVSLILFQRGGAYDTGRQGTPNGEKKRAIVNVINYSGAFPACHNVSKCRPRKKVDCD